jgi:hypothetical protein
VLSHDHAHEHEHDDAGHGLLETARAALCLAYLGAYVAVVLAFGSIAFPTGAAARVVAALALLAGLVAAACRGADWLRNRNSGPATIQVGDRSRSAIAHDRALD